MKDPKLIEVHSWLEKARQDLDAAAWLFEGPQNLLNAVSFHCQQASEKALKAYLTSVDEPFGKTHSLVALVGLCLKHDQDFVQLRSAATTLTPFAVMTRYPGDLPEISNAEAKDALGYAQQIWDFIIARLPEIDLYS
jgi:HEPN domain-containing protein